MALPQGLREFDDASSTRANIYTDVLGSVSKRFPVEDDDWRLELVNPRYDGKQDFSLGEQKHALLTQRNITTPIKGTWRLTDKKSGQVQEREDTVMQVPYYSNRGTMINNGSEYAVINQARLRPGVYVRRKRTGEVETQFNVESGKGKGFRMSLEPSTGIFKVNVAQSSVPAYPLLQTMGVPDEVLEKSWGRELLEANKQARGQGSIAKLYARFAGYNADATADEASMSKFVREALPKFGIDPEVTTRTLGLKGKTGIDADVLRRATEKMLAVSRSEEDADDRDSPEFKEYLGPEDLLAERVSRDSGRLTQNLLRKLRRTRDLKSVPRSALNPYMQSFVLGSGLATPLEESNPLHYLEQMNRVTGFGEGGIGSEAAITDDARELNPNQLGFIGTVEGPESGRIGVDGRVAFGAFKGNDKRIYGHFKDAKTGEDLYLRPDQTSSRTVGFSSFGADKGRYVTAIRNGKTVRVPREEVDIVLPSLARQFAQGVNLNSMPTGMQGARQFYASKFWTQFLPLKQGELPLVDSLMPDGKSTFMEYYGKKSGTLNADFDGVVKRVTDDKIVVTDAQGKDHEVETVKDFPFNRMSGVSYYSTVKPGDQVKKGQMLAHSNFTDAKTGSINFGRNLKTAIIPAKGWSNDDSAVISETASQMLATSRLYGFDLEARHGVEMGRDKYAALFPGKFDKKQIENLDEDGIVKPGTVLHKGDPIILAVGPKLLTPADAQLGKLHKVLRNSFTNKAVVWEHDYPGTVADAVSIRGGKAASVNIKAEPPVQIGDKLTSGFAVKGTVGKIIKDDAMPRDAATNEPYQILFNPTAFLSRVTPNQIAWMAASKVAKKLGQQIRIPQDAPEEGWAKWAQDLLDKHGLSAEADLFDPDTGRTVKGVGDGYAYVHSFHHLSEKKLSSRGGGGSYDINQQPAKGGYSGAKRFSGLDVGAALSHGATAVLKDVFAIRGTRNEDYWKALRSGQPLPKPGVPFIYDKFLNTLRAGGIDVRENGSKTSILPMTDDAVKAMGAKEINSSEMLDYDFNPRPGGLFDPGITGGPDGNKWTYVKLDEPVPNPVMEEPIRRILGITGKQMRDILAGKEKINGMTGGAAIRAALGNMEPKERLADLKRTIKTTRGNSRDAAVKAAGYIDAAMKQGINPEQWMVTHVPVIPPKFRPISRMGDMGLVADLNELYKDLIEAKKGLGDLKGAVADTDLADDRLNVYDAVKAVYGLGDPITPEGRSKRLKGAIWQVTGDTPKFGMYQSKVVAKTVDAVSRGVIGPDPDLDMDHIGIPENAAWDQYKDFVERRLTRKGYPLIKAAEMVKDRTPVAKEMLLEEMRDRPVIVDRAPTWHRFNLMGFYPVLTKGDTIKVSPLVTKGFNADFDGDTMSMHVPVSDEAKEEVKEKMLPSRNLFSGTDLRSPQHTPRMELTMGIYLLTRPPSKKPVTRFRDAAEAKAAYRRGEIGANDPVEIQGL
jgi:DNA-directed RNA polymerase beta subunit